MTRRVTRKRITDEGSRIYDCPVCRQGEVSVADNVFYGKCNYCSATLIDYVPLTHQEDFHNSSAQYRLNIGGYGSGKTTAACAEISHHLFSVKNARVLITAPILSQVNDAVLPELDKFIPPWFIEQHIRKPSPYYKLSNGSEVLVYASNDQQKLRSLNLTAFYIEEASGVDYSVFDQLQSRLRNKAAVMKDKNGNEIGYQFMGILSTNPEDGWIKDKFLLISDELYSSPSIDVNVYAPLIDATKTNRHFHTFISSTRDNNHVPAEFIERMSAGKSAQWVRKYIDCYLDFKEGAVYPEFLTNLIDPFQIPAHWKRVAGFDPGYNDPTAFVIAAINPENGIVYIYDEYKEAEKPVGFHGDKIKAYVDTYEFLFPIQADPSVQKRNDRDGVSYADYFKKVSNGVRLEPGNNDLLYGIEKVRDYLYNGKLKIFNSCLKLINEASKYTYKDSDNRNTNDKPIDKDNHLMDAMRYMVARLPKNPNELSKIYSGMGIMNAPTVKKSKIIGAFTTSIKQNDKPYSKKTVGGINI